MWAPAVCRVLDTAIGDNGQEDRGEDKQRREYGKGLIVK
jgi:hypothetical protein